MQNHEAEMLCAKLSQAWGRAPSDTWIEFLCELDDAGRAGTAFVRLRDTCQRMPSMADFRQAYNAVRGETPHVHCAECDGTGMVPEFDPRAGRNLAQSVPCTCEHGDRMLRLIASQGERNASAGKRIDDRTRIAGLRAIAAIRGGLSADGLAALDELEAS